MSIVFRPARTSDLAAVLRLAESLGGAMPSLPADATALGKAIRRSQTALARTIASPGAERYLFVCERDGKVLATSAIAASAGGDGGHHAFALGRDGRREILVPTRVRPGPTELCALAVAPAARREGLGRLATLGRLAFAGCHRDRVRSRIVAQIRGWRVGGRSPFWDEVGRAFFAPFDLDELDRALAAGDPAARRALGARMPRHPIYVDLLRGDVEDAIGRPHADAEGAVRLLCREGLRSGGHVHVLDAGPTLGCPTRAVRTIAALERGRVAEMALAPTAEVLVAAGRGSDFRATVGPATVTLDGRVSVSLEVAEVLGLSVGEAVAVSPVTAALAVVAPERLVA